MKKKTLYLKLREAGRATEQLYQELTTRLDKIIELERFLRTANDDAKRALAENRQLAVDNQQLRAEDEERTGIIVDLRGEYTELTQDFSTLENQREGELKALKAALALIKHYHTKPEDTPDRAATSAKLEAELNEALKPATIDQVLQPTMHCKAVIGLLCLRTDGIQCEAGKCLREPVKRCRDEELPF
jgi:chromosome segregation ATPase